MADDVVVRPLDADRADEIELVAARMRLTLIEVLDQARADAMFDHRALMDRVHWHLDEPRAEVFLAVGNDEIVGHTMVRVENEDGNEVGLFATTYVDPAHRRHRTASLLLATGEEWMERQGVADAVTYTDRGNDRLIALYRHHGYSVAFIDDEWARAHRSLGLREL